MKTLIWDFNGTIVDDLQLCLDIENKMLEERGMKAGYTKEQYRELFSFPVQDYYYKIGYTFENETYAQISDEFNALYDQGFESCHLTDGFTDKINESIAKGYQNIILSATKQDKLLEQCEILHITKYFTQILGMDNNLAAGKTEMARRWMKSSDVKPEECMYIGDTLHDKETAEAIGIDHYVLVSTGHQSYHVLSSKSDHVVHSLKEIRL